MTNNNYSPLPFYTTQDEFNANKSYAFGHVYDLLCPLGIILPFQIVTDYISGASVSSVNLIRLSDNDERECISDLGQNIEVIEVQDTNKAVIAFSPREATLTDVSLGRHRVELTYGEHTFYSDVFTWVGEGQRLLEIYWWDLTDIKCDPSVIVYNSYTGGKFVNVIYLPTELGKPEYSFEEEGESRDGLFFPYKQVSEKRFKCSFIAPEYLCDLLRVIRMSDRIHVYDYLGRHYKVDNLDFVVNWQDQGDLAAVELTLETDTIIKKTLWYKNSGDYNVDFSDDFDRFIP